MTNTVADTDCGDIDLTTVRLSRGAHGATFTGACCVIEKSNRLAACRVDLKAKYGADPPTVRARDCHDAYGGTR